MQNRKIKYVAEVAPVKEVTLHGLADLSCWREQLQSDGLEPVARDGQAQLFLSVTEARFMGIRFRECIIGIHVQHTGGPGDLPAMFLLHAWNSLSAFAWIERTMFATPYYAGQIGVDPNQPARMQVAERGQVLMSAAMQAKSREPEQIVDESWHGAIYLPRRQNKPQQLFLAKLDGRTEHYPFDAPRDTFTLQRSASCPTMGWLIDSKFAPHAWHVRQAAAHAKSKTYAAEQLAALIG